MLEVELPVNVVLRPQEVAETALTLKNLRREYLDNEDTEQ